MLQLMYFGTTSDTPCSWCLVYTEYSTRVHSFGHVKPTRKQVKQSAVAFYEHDRLLSETAWLEELFS
ncbi:hypothetical protein [Vibrio phage JSF7]|uniref:Uncharacterized protein n=1 Tax=Vibrio phage JSF7 TaxID=1292086 RepID=A0A240EWV3_9CAUD|nr:hypothetical protein HOQ92_gp20 [Vibrio phage JSF7]APD18144.1 hypothetical protein [Vibrio phage JSF7]